jgi:colanic acid biosynthesis glycosyl transferase WcaI
VLSDGAWRNLTRKGVPAEKLRLIPNFVNTAFVRPGPKDNAFARAHGLQDRLVVMYAGNIGLSQDLTVMLAAASALREETAIQFVIVGNGAARDGLVRMARQLDLSNVLFLPFQNRSWLPDVYATADVSLVSLREGLGEVSVPSKAYTIMASGRPMIAAVGREAETHALIEAAACGLWVPADDASAMVAAIRELAADPALRLRLGANGRRYVEAHFGPERVTDQYLRLFAMVHEGQGQGSS